MQFVGSFSNFKDSHNRSYLTVARDETLKILATKKFKYGVMKIMKIIPSRRIYHRRGETKSEMRRNKKCNLNEERRSGEIIHLWSRIQENAKSVKRPKLCY